MRRLILLRHSKTERAAPGEPDRDRKLMKRGRADAPIIGAYMAHHGLIPDLALVSPAMRTQETWTLVAASFFGGIATQRWLTRRESAPNYGPPAVDFGDPTLVPMP